MVRAVGAHDGAQLARMLRRLSPSSLERRFFGPVASQVEWLAAQLARFDDPRQHGVVATVGDEVVGHASLHVVPGAPDAAEVAVIVADEWQRRGLARRMLRDLTRVARHRGITRYEAIVLAANQPALTMVRRLAPGAPARFDGPEIHVDIDIAGEHHRESSDRPPGAGHCLGEPPSAAAPRPCLGDTSAAPQRLGGRVGI